MVEIYELKSRSIRRTLPARTWRCEPAALGVCTKPRARAGMPIGPVSVIAFLRSASPPKAFKKNGSIRAAAHAATLDDQRRCGDGDP
jgi:hypothetical protein